MGKIGHCCHCRRQFQRRPQNPTQQYCSRAECQRARKNAYQRRKMKEDDDYRENQLEAQRKWRGKRPGYWREYRLKHPAYTDGNRTRQQERNRRKRQDDGQPSVAKMDVSTIGQALPSGRYRISRIGGEGTAPIANMDALIVEINVLPAG